MNTSACEDPEKMEVDKDSAEECNFESDENENEVKKNTVLTKKNQKFLH